MASAFVGIGSNIDREANIRRAVAALARRYRALKISTVYRSQAIGFEGDDFYNLVAGFETDSGAYRVADFLRRTEHACGRRRAGRRLGPRTVDIDLLLYDDLVIDDGVLQLPRADITRYAFVLRPLAEIAGGLRHPLSGRTYRELWREFGRDGQPLAPVEFPWGAAGP